MFEAATHENLLRLFPKIIKLHFDLFMNFQMVKLSNCRIIFATLNNIEMEQNNQQQQNQLNIELTEEMSEGIYSNLAIITHSNAEFVIDFINSCSLTLIVDFGFDCF